jgi:hypothetical protein
VARDNLRKCERLVELDGRLGAILLGEAKPKDAAETIEFAWLCQRYKHRNATATRLYEEAFAAEPELAADMQAQHRYNAACAAVTAAAGQGEDAASLNEAQRARLRRQALDWLRADLVFWRDQFDAASNIENARSVLRHWQQDTDLTEARVEESLSKLPEAEQESWRKLWADVAEVLKVGIKE